MSTPTGQLDLGLATPAAAEGGHTAWADFDDTRRYRYALGRVWGTPIGAGGLIVHWIMLNPSTADEAKLDATLRRCKGYSQTWGYDGMVITNLFAYRSRWPADLRRVDDPVGPDNDQVLADTAGAYDLTIVGWGTGIPVGRLAAARGAAVYDLIAGRLPLCLGVTKHGQPLHPLMQPADARPVGWTPPAR